MTPGRIGANILLRSSWWTRGSLPPDNRWVPTGARCASSSRPPPQSCNFVLFRVNARPAAVAMDGWTDDGRRLAPLPPPAPAPPFILPLSVCPGLSGSSRIPPSSPAGASPRFSCVLSITSSPPSNLPEREKEGEVLERKGTTMGRKGGERRRVERRIKRGTKFENLPPSLPPHYLLLPECVM